MAHVIEAYLKLLRVWTPQSAPLEYAATQNNLGLAYAKLARSQDSIGNLARAIDAYWEALRFRTLDRTPQDYAETQYNLANAYADLAATMADPVGNLQRAIEAYNEALRVWTPTHQPLDYAGTQAGLGVVYKALGLYDQAVDCWWEAEHYFRTLGQQHHADMMIEWIERRDEE